MKRTAALLTAALLGTLAAAPAVASPQQEQQIGQQVYAQLQQKGEIIPRPNPMYDVLDPIAHRIAQVADPQYDFPFRFILVHEAQPNAFAVPGGNVYVTDSLIKFVQNREELAGVLCHETSHDIHHDVVNNMQKDQTTGALIGILGAITGLNRSGFGQLGENLAYTLQTNNFSRDVEHNADAKGAVTCAQAGYNPWGMIWLFQNFEKADTGGTMEALSDHPTDQHRIDDLKREFAANPALFGKFSSNIATATPIGRTAATAPPAAVVTLAPRPRATPSYCCTPRGAHADAIRPAARAARATTSGDGTSVLVGQ
jgi:predicted Zn-dependent protease